MKIARLGIAGGSFNPIHHGHLIAAERACEELRLDRVLFIPTAQTPLREHALAPAARRMEMVRLAVRGHPKFEATDIEIRRGGLSYTYDTVTALHTDAKIFVIIGDDEVSLLPKWYRIGDLSRLVTFAVVDRPGKYEPAPPGPWQLRRVRTPLIEISATEIRQRVSRGLSIRYLLPDSVERYVHKHGLYK